MRSQQTINAIMLIAILVLSIRSCGILSEDEISDIAGDAVVHVYREVEQQKEQLEDFENRLDEIESQID